MASKKYDGPYEVQAVTWNYDHEIEGWQVVSKPFELPHTPGVWHRTTNSQIYEHRQAAYRRCAALNKEWQDEQAVK